MSYNENTRQKDPEMEKNKTFLNTKMTDLTISEVVLLNTVFPVLMIGTVIGSLGLAVASRRAIRKFKNTRENRKDKV